MLTLSLTTEQAIIVRNALKVLLQQSMPESRPDIQEMLDSVDLYLAIASRRPNNTMEDVKS